MSTDVTPSRPATVHQLSASLKLQSAQDKEYASFPAPAFERALDETDSGLNVVDVSQGKNSME